jgi:hypothetical protein
MPSKPENVPSGLYSIVPTLPWTSMLTPFSTTAFTVSEGGSCAMAGAAIMAAAKSASRSFKGCPPTWLI